MRKLEIAAAIEKAIAGRAERAELTADLVIDELRKIAGANDGQGDLKFSQVLASSQHRLREAIAVLGRLQREPTPPVGPCRARAGSARSVPRCSPAFSNATLPTVRTALTTSRPQNCVAVCRRACNQIERKTIPNYCKLFNEFPG